MTRQLTQEELDYAREVAEAAPPFTAEQVQLLSRTLAPAIREVRAQAAEQRAA